MIFISYLSSTFLGLLFTLLDCVSFGKLLIPEHEDLSMFIFIYAAIVSQFLFTFFSSIQTGMLSGAILENIVIIKTIYENLKTQCQDDTKTVQATLLCIFMSTLLFSLLSHFVVKFKLDGYLRNIPKTAVVGCLGAIGICQLSIGYDSIVDCCKEMSMTPKLITWILTILIGFLAFIIQDFLPNIIYIVPLFTIISTIIFYLGIKVFGFTVEDIRNLSILPISNQGDSILKSLPLFPLKYLFITDLSIIPMMIKNIVPIITLSLMSMIHLPINFPIFCTSTLTTGNFNKEIRAQSIANIFTFIPSYFICSNSIFFTKAGGSSKMHSYILGFATIIIFFCKYLAPFIPVFISNMFPFFIGFSILVGTYRDTKDRNLFDKLVVGLAILIGFHKMEYAMLFGLVMNGVWFIQKSVKMLRRKNSKNLTVDNVARINFLACFATLDTLRDEFRNKKMDTRLIVDMRDCGGMDWIAEDTMMECISLFEDVVVVGYKLRDTTVMKEEELISLLVE